MQTVVSVAAAVQQAVLQQAAAGLTLRKGLRVPTKVFLATDSAEAAVEVSK